MTDRLTVPRPGSEPVEDYLDRLPGCLGGPPRQARRILAEAESHLRDVVDEGLAAGLPEDQAQRAAVDRMGPPHLLAGRRAGFARPGRARARRTFLGVTLVGTVALLAVAVAGAGMWLLATAFGGRFVTAPWPPGSYTAADCHRWLAGDSATRSCVTAMIRDHVGDILLQCAAAGLLGLAAVAVYLVLRRRWDDQATRTALPEGSAEGAGAALAAVVAVVATIQGLDLLLVQHGAGAGQPLSLAAAAALAGVFLGARLLRVTGWRPRWPGRATSGVPLR